MLKKSVATSSSMQRSLVIISLNSSGVLTRKGCECKPR